MVDYSNYSGKLKYYSNGCIIHFRSNRAASLLSYKTPIFNLTRIAF